MQPQVIGILAAVVTAGVGYHYLTKDKEEEETTTTSDDQQVTPTQTDDSTSCSDDLGCPADEPYCVDGKCSDTFPIATHFTKKSGSLYPKMGMSNHFRNLSDKSNEPRAQYKTLSEAAKACNDDPDCVGFTYWSERYTLDNPKGADESCSSDSDCSAGKCWEGKCRSAQYGLSYFWSNTSAPQIPSDYDGDTWKSAKGGLSLSQGVGPSNEYLDTRRPRNVAAHHVDSDVTKSWKYEQHMKQVGTTYLKKGMEDFKYSDSFEDDGTAKTQTSSAESDNSMHMTDTGNPFYHPASNPSGSGFVISDKSTKV